MSPTLDPNETLYVFDGTAFLFRSYFGKIRMTSPENVQVGAVMGLCMTVAKLVSMTRPTYLAAVFDAGRFTFRNQIDSGYKANRGDPPEDLVPQFPLAQAAIQALGIPTFSVPGYEADDLMATLAKRMEEQRFNTVLVASDKDLMQLIRPGVWVMDPRTYGLVGAPEVEAKFGVQPEQMIDLQALIGDSTDNISGVRGVGAKSGAALLQAMGTVENAYAHLEEVAKLPIRGAASLARKLDAGRDDLALSRELVTLRDDVPDGGMPEVEAKSLRYGGAPASGEAFFDSMGFHRPYRTLRAWGKEA